MVINTMELKCNILRAKIYIKIENWNIYVQCVSDFCVLILVIGLLLQPKLTKQYVGIEMKDISAPDGILIFNLTPTTVSLGLYVTL